jgi:membrane-associated phospholipid phosphatase
MATTTAATSPSRPALWYEPAPYHFDQRIPWWVKCLLLLAAIVASVHFIDQPLAQWCFAHPIPDLASKRPKVDSHSDLARELMFLEQVGQFACSIMAVLAVYFLDPKGRRRALSIALACLLTVAFTHLFKDLIGRSRPFNVDVPGFPDARWIWGGPGWGFHHGSPWGSFPSAHTSAVFALASSLTWFYPRGRALFMFMALITATLRVLHFAHYLSDVLAGMALGVFVARATLHMKIPGYILRYSLPSARAWWMRDMP